jgi:hypothetical protein
MKPAEKVFKTRIGFITAKHFHIYMETNLFNGSKFNITIIIIIIIIVVVVVVIIISIFSRIKLQFHF